MPKIANKNTKKTVETCPNPFFVGLDGGSVGSLDGKTLYSNYKIAWILCTRPDMLLTIDEQKLLYGCDTVITGLQSFVHKLALVRVDAKILRNKQLKQRANIVDGNILTYLFGNFTKEQQEIILIMPELNTTYCELYASLHTSYDTNLFARLASVANLMAVYNRSQTSLIDNQIVPLIYEIDDEKYWTFKKNTKFNGNDVFNLRKLTEENNETEQTKIAHKNTNYLETFQKTIRFHHMNIYDAIKTSSNRSFFATNLEDVKLSKDTIANIFDIMDNKKYRFCLFNVLLTSKKYCHLVANNKRVLQRNADLLELYKPLYSILWGYAWTTLYLEESIFTTKSTKDNRFVFDIDTASILPTFPFTYEAVKISPYMTLQLSDELLAIDKNCIGINALENYAKYYGTCDKTEAKRRMNVFTTGNSDKYLFDGIGDMFAVSGSIMTACLPKLSPLFEACTTENMTYDEKWQAFFAKYYTNSDVDLMCMTDMVLDFLRLVTELLKQLSVNLGCSVDEIEILPNKSACVIICSPFYDHCLPDLNSALHTEYTQNDLVKIIDQMTENVELFPEVRNYFYEDYTNEKTKSNMKLNMLLKTQNLEINPKLLETYRTIVEQKELTLRIGRFDVIKTEMKMRDNEIYNFVNDFKDGKTSVSEHKNFLVYKIAETVKFKLASPLMVRNVEVFRIDNTDPFKTVARFHNPCVRAYRHKDDFWMLPSFITATMLLLNIDYKYFACSKNPIDIIDKYRSRGYGVILNDNERRAVVSYYRKLALSQPSQLVNFNASSTMGPRMLDNYNLCYLTSVQQLKQVYLELFKFDANNAPFDLFKFTTIQPDGNIRQLQPWLAHMYYEYVNEQK